MKKYPKFDVEYVGRSDTHKELPLIEDKIQQIFKFLEIADVSQWQDMNVFEAGDADSLYGILKTAFEQVRTATLEEAIRAIEKMKEEELAAKPANDLEKTAEWYKISTLDQAIALLQPKEDIKS